jgi:predicted nucleotidyltransferase
MIRPGLTLAATTDVDLVLVADDWQSYAETFAPLTPFGPHGMMFTVAGIRGDILPFGRVVGVGAESRAVSLLERVAEGLAERHRSTA